MPAAGCRMPDAGCRMPDAGCRIKMSTQEVSLMKRFVLILAVLGVSCSAENSGSKAAASPEVAAWEQRAQTITITRDDWGIPHVHGKTDADAVFGAIYAQAEDDFNRVETNYINGMGRLAEAEGEREIWRDLRMKLFVDPEDLKAKYKESPESLQKLMDGWADGLNYFLHTHPNVKPRVITHFEPWMALSFTEGSIGGDIEEVKLTQLEEFYGKKPVSTTAEFIPLAPLAEPTGSNGLAVAPANTVNKHALLYIN